jgi:biopolymer transport protein ExbB
VLSARLDAFAYELHSFLTLGEAPGAGATGNVRPLKSPATA